MQLEVRSKSYHVTVHQHHADFPLLVLLHGFMGSGKAFSHVIDELKEFCNPVTIDLLGHGDTEGDTGAGRFRSSEQVKDLHEILSHFSSDDVILHGYSMGGRLVLQYAVTYPDSVSGLILESTTCGMSSQQERRKRQKLDEQRAGAIETDFEKFLNTWNQLSIFNNGVEVPSSLKKDYQQIQANQRPIYMANSLRGFGTGTMPSTETKLDKLSMPVLILTGEADDKYCKISDEMQQDISNSNAIVVEHAGHRVHLENPKDFISELKSFLMPYQKT